MYAIQDASADFTFLKFITPTSPLGQWTGRIGPKSFETKEAAELYLERLCKAVMENAWVGASLRIENVTPGNVARGFSILNDAGLECECFKVVPYPSNPNK